jgi:serine/threonine protein kinase
MHKLSSNLNGYTIGDRIGRGARSVICEIRRHRDGAVFASKCIHLRAEKDKKALRHLENENRVLRDLHSGGEAPPQLVRRVELVRARKFFRLQGACLILERIQGPDLQCYADYSLDKKLDITEQICEALAFIHEQGYIHGDVKPDNILVNGQGRAKLIDFGFAAPIGTDVDGVKGTWGFMAPEQTGGTLEPETDVYNLGAVMYWLFTGENLPYVIPGGAAGDGLAGQVDPTPPHHLNTDLPRRLSRLIMHCCDSDAATRPTLTQLQNRLHDIGLQLRLSV